MESMFGILQHDHPVPWKSTQLEVIYLLVFFCLAILTVLFRLYV